ncbi:hypothetical protein FV220_25050 [Methylobacterium sp. WL19]|nr:hypothetical protein FV220_25050 [Methylobacterium sp. WL19]
MPEEAGEAGERQGSKGKGSEGQGSEGQGSQGQGSQGQGSQGQVRETVFHGASPRLRDGRVVAGAQPGLDRSRTGLPPSVRKRTV